MNSTTMRAVIFLGERRLELQDIPIPQPGPGEALEMMIAGQAVKIAILPER